MYGLVCVSLGFLIGLFMGTQYITSIGLFYNNSEILLGVLSDCEELVGVGDRR